jgi:very-short-patch-repair endonuclease
MPSTDNARTLRRHSTDAERVLWRHLRARQLTGVKFRRQQPLGPYVVDFVCLENRLVVEVDGGQHARQRQADAERDAWLTRQGYRVLRFWNNDVLREPAAVLQSIDRAVRPD